jgi:2-polyprenyl-6-hydroxyphenyl methylase/3-demethylubiquinone-9 3-methyltransferase
MDRASNADPGGAIRSIVSSYDDPVIRLYSRLRFTILRQTFLEEIGQYLPPEGRVLDLGCGFGLFSLYFAALEPGRRITGVDRSAKRIAQARESARRLGIENVGYQVAEGLEWSSEETFEAIYLLDLIHHLPRDSVPGFLERLRARLVPGGVLVLKEIEDRPRWKVGFTLLLDRLMVGRESIHYWSPGELISLLRGLGFEVVRHRVRDVLPYPHIIYVGRLPGGASLSPRG